MENHCSVDNGRYNTLAVETYFTTKSGHAFNSPIVYATTISSPKEAISTAFQSEVLVFQGAVYKQPRSCTSRIILIIMPTSTELALVTSRRDAIMTTIQEGQYLDTLMEFIRRCDQEEVMLEWIRTRCPNILNVLPFSDISQSNPIRVIGVGCGNGIMDVQILREICSLSRFVQEIAVEPNDSQLLLFKERIEADEILMSMSFDWMQTTTEVFEVSMDRLSAEGAFPKAHLVHMLQMLYHARDMENTIRNYYKVLHEGGVLLITIASKKNNDLFKSFQDLEPKRSKREQKNKKRYSEDVTRVLRRLGLKYDVENVIYHLDITHCLNEKSESGRLLLDFICLTNAAQVYQTLPTADRERLMKRLVDLCEKHPGPNGRVTVRLSFDAIVVTKKEGQGLLSSEPAADAIGHEHCV